MFPSLIPAVVESYDQATRTCRISIDGITDGADVMPEAEILYPIGDKSQHTELEILAGDLVWVAFQNGDPRYPVICGSRAKNAGNSADWRKYHHANIELNADGDIYLKAGALVHVVAPTVFVEATDTHVVSDHVLVESTDVTVKATTVVVESPISTFKGQVKVEGTLTYMAGMVGSGVPTGGGGGASAKITGSIELVSGDISADGVGLKAHRHQEHDGYYTSNSKV